MPEVVELESVPRQRSEEERAASYQEFWEQNFADPQWGVPLHRQLGLHLLQLRPTTVLSMELSDSVRGFYPGSVHGGILATFADVASATALWDSFDRETSIPVTTDIHVRYYRQPKSGPLTAEVRVVHEGRRLLSTECVVSDGEGRVLARTSGTFAIQPLRTGASAGEQG
jgi:uncharacterized protein (TIGR00369 family)